MNRHHVRRLLFLCMIILILLTLFSCRRHRKPSFYFDESPIDARTTAQNMLEKAHSGSDLEQRQTAITRRFARQNTNSVSWGTAADVAGRAGGIFSASGRKWAVSTVSNTSSASYSWTPVQENGGDEADLVKTDGKYIYLARGTRFFIVATEPTEDSAIVSDMDLMEQISALYLSGQTIVLITSPVTVYPVGGASLSSATVIPYRPVTRLHIYDVSSPDVPLLTASFDFPGHIKGPRRMVNRLHIIRNTVIALPDPAAPS